MTEKIKITFKSENGKLDDIDVVFNKINMILNNKDDNSVISDSRFTIEKMNDKPLKKGLSFNDFVKKIQEGLK